MITPPQVLTTNPQTIAIIPIVVPRDQIRTVMGPGLNELKSAVAAQGIEITGPWFTHHLRITPQQFNFEICVPVKSPVKPAGRMKPGAWPAIRVAQTVYHGDYKGLPSAWSEFEAWIKENGHKSAEDLWERYVIDPSVTPDSTAWRTELNRPLLDE